MQRHPIDTVDTVDTVALSRCIGAFVRLRWAKITYDTLHGTSEG